MSNPLADMQKPEVIFCIGTNMTECHPVAATGIKKAIAKGSKMIVADPRRIGLADLSHLYLPLRVGSDVALLLAMAHVIQREGLANNDFIETRTKGIQDFLNHIEAFTPEWAATITGLNPKDIEAAAILYASANRSAIYYTLGITEHICGVDNVQSLSNLALMTGHIGKEGTGLNPMRGQNNIQGAGDSGALPNNYPGFQSVLVPEHQAKFEKQYGRKVDLEKGITKVAALNQCGNQIRAMLINGENTLISDPDRHHCQQALESLDHLVVIDIFLTETAELADVVLPATAFAETDGTATNTERRVQRLRAAVSPPGKAKPDWWIIAQMAQRLGLSNFDYQHPKAIFNELCRLSPVYAGLNWERIEDGQYQWPVPEVGHPGTPVLHQDEFVNGRGVFKITSYRDPHETISNEYPIWLTTGRRLTSYHTRTQTGRSAGIDYLLAEEALEVNPNDMKEWGLTEGEWYYLSSSKGRVKIRVRSTKKSPPGTVFASFSFSDVPINVLTGGGYDPITETAELKVCPVKIEPVYNR